MKQQHSSPLQPDEVQKRLKHVADNRFSNASGRSTNPEKVYEREMVCNITLQDSLYICTWYIGCEPEAAYQQYTLLHLVACLFPLPMSSYLKS